MNTAYFIINGKVIDICYSEIYSKKIEKIMGYNRENVIAKSPCMEIILSADSIIIKYDNVITEFYHINSTDIYPIIYSAIYQLMNVDNYIMMHSCVVNNNNNEGILILGDFGAGKTTLLKEFIANGWVANSTDQSLLKIKNKNLIFVCGSTYSDNQIPNIECKKIDSIVVINKILFVDAMVGNGDFLNIATEEYKIKFRKIWSNMFWPWSTPLIGNMQFLSIKADQLRYMCGICKRITEIFNCINIVRGNKSTCIKEFLF